MDFIDYRKKLGIGFCDEEKFKYLKVKIFNILNGIEKGSYSGCIDNEEYKTFCNTIGLQINYNLFEDYKSIERFSYCISVIERTRTLNDFLAYYIAFVNSIKVKKYSSDYWIREDFASILCKMLEESHILYDLYTNNEEYFIFPKGAQELDDVLVSQPLEWLEDYPTTRVAFIRALKAYAEQDEDNISNVADGFRKTLETFFQEFFCSSKSLENLKSQYGSYMKEHGVPPEISGNFETLLQSYTKYMNNYAKHCDKVSKNVLEYLLYQTGNIIRLLVTLKQKG